jgi:tetratricopeptide (TPR) repeat protein
VNYRPEYAHGWAHKTYYQQLRLDPLPAARAEELLQALLGDDAGLESLRRLLIERTEGNPFFLEESVRSLVETGGLVGERGAYRLAQPLATTQVPATVQAVLAARIDRLDPGDKRLLQCAAVIGKGVPYPLLQAIAELPESALQAAEFLYEASLYPTLDYTFKHALTHEVTYGSLLQERRRALHARIVERIEERFADRLAEQVERLAYHAVRGERWDSAVLYSRQAGLKAQARSAHREAAECFEQALLALEHLPETRGRLEQAIDLRMELRRSLVPLGDQRRFEEHLRAAEILASRLGDERRIGYVAAYMSGSYWMIGDHSRAIEAGQRARAIAMELGDRGLRLQSNSRLGYAYLVQGEYRRAIEFLQTNVAELEGDLARHRSGGAGLPAVDGRSFSAWCLSELGEFVTGHARVAEAVRLAEEFDEPFSLAIALWCLGYLALRRGDYAAAIPALERSVEVCQDLPIPLWLPVATSTLGYSYSLSGRLVEGLPMLEHAAAQTDALGLGRHMVPLDWLGEAYLFADRMEDARSAAGRALTQARERKERGHAAWTLRLIGEIAVCANPPEVELAESHYRQALALAGELGMRPLAAHCHLGLGTLYQRVRRDEEARAELTTAAEMYRAMEMTFWLAKAAAAVAQVAS